jgi:hypothetical protein
MSNTSWDGGSIFGVLSKGGGRCRAGIIAGAVTGLLAGIGVAVALGNTFFKGGDDLDHASFWSVIVIFGLVGFMGGAWGGALTAKCWDDDGNKPPNSG